MPRDPEPIELEPASGIRPREDLRPRVPTPPPVRVVAVENVHLLAQTGLERELDAFYAGVFHFERDAEFPEQIIYHAENVAIHIELVEGLVERASVRPTGVEIFSLAALQNVLIDREIEFTRQKGLTPGQESILVLDPAGNWIEATEIRLI